MKRSSLMLLAALVLTGYADAAPIAIKISGQVRDVLDHWGFLGGVINVGDTISGTYIYESTTPNTSPFPNVGIYEHTTPPFGITLHVGGLVFRTDPAQVDFRVLVAKDLPEIGDGYLVQSTNNIFEKSVPPRPSEDLENTIEWQLDDPTATVLSSIALPMEPPVLADWQSIVGLTIDSSNGPSPSKGSNFFSIDADVTSAVLIPEPSSALLLCAGLGSLLGYWLWMGKFQLGLLGSTASAESSRKN